jgi:hypothetical protein
VIELKGETNQPSPNKIRILNVSAGKPPLGQRDTSKTPSRDLSPSTKRVSNEKIFTTSNKREGMPNFLMVPDEKNITKTEGVLREGENKVFINNDQRAMYESISFKGNSKYENDSNAEKCSFDMDMQKKRVEFEKNQRKKMQIKKKKRREEGILESLIFLSDNFEVFLCIELDKIGLKIFDNLAAASGHILEVSMPPGEIKLSLNNPFSTTNFVEVFGIRIETPDKLKAVYFFVQVRLSIN